MSANNGYNGNGHNGHAPARHLFAPLFTLGRIVATPGAIEAMRPHAGLPWILLRRHATGDWGDCYPEDAALNDAALLTEGRIFSVYHTPEQTHADAPEPVKLWIITEWDRSVTTILLPEEY